ncbi:coiled-coil domain-containing protein 14-like isoform X2 [Sebastes umbrosus]|uniref:coiled-coil domain-containing protein 14-like isoform X2 n=1 Tax=Sebastes umbrosus TaxID=72105 RepID=UPI00189F867A|nr:coiled-coil domain-containing protein 14-like isoform X2 [Sebastes umbrosus]
MKGTAKSKVVTSGRLTGGGVKGQLTRRRLTPNQGPAARPEPAYSLYSTDSEDQVTTLHQGLDRCAALLSGILQAEKAEAMPGPPRALKGGAAKSRPSTSLGKKTTKNTETGLKSRQSVQRGPGPGSTTSRATHQSTVPAARSQVQLRPPQIQPPTLLQDHLHPPPSQTLQHLPLTNPPPQPQTSIPPPQPQTSIPPTQTSIPPPQTSFPPPQPQTSIPPPQTFFPPPQPQNSIPSPQTSLPPPMPQTPIPPPQPQTSISPPQTSISPPLPPTSIPPPLPQTSIPPPQTSIPPPQTSAPPHQTSIPPHQTSIPPPETSFPPHQTSIPPPQLPLPQTDCQAECDREEEEFVPVRDITTRSTATDAHTAVRHSHIHTCTTKMSNMQLEPGQLDKVPQDTHSGEDSSAETGVKMRTVQHLLGELKALIAGQGSVAERLLSHLEQAVSSPLMDVGRSNLQTEPDLSSLHSQNTQLRRRVRLLNQQLKEREKAERQQNMEPLCNSEVFTLQEELTTAQTRLQELQDDLTGLREALQYTQGQLADREAENTLIKTDLEATRSRLLDSEREKTELASLAQQRLEEIGNLNRILRSHDLSNCPTVVDALPAKQHFNQQQHRLDPAESPTDRITQFLMSLGQLDPTHAEHVAAERDGDTLEQKKLTSVQLRDTLSRPDVRCQRGDKPAESARHRSDEVQSCGWPLEKERRHLSQCDVESVWSDWSMRSGSTFDTRDEAAFRDGLAALDASIASLQKTIQLDLGR